MFNVLDKDDDGIISKISINILSLNDKIYNLIEPIINELKVENVTLNLKEFSLAITELMTVRFILLIIELALWWKKIFYLGVQIKKT